MLTKQEQEKRFQTIYEGLNEAQKKAVDTIEGPVMVIAGPGTGKTQILSARIGKILLTTDAQPDNILCLTYTDAGVVAMRKRLQSFIGSDAYRVHIATFHAFCNDIIQDNLSVFEKNALDPVSDLEKIEYLKELIDAFPKGHPLKRYRGDVYYEMMPLSNLFSTMKREGWTPDFLIEKIDKFLCEIRDCEEGSSHFKAYKYQRTTTNYKKGDPRPAMQEMIDKMEKLRAAVGEFDNYQALMHKRNRYDFDDMINWVIKAFEENNLLLRKYQEQYQYILVDEYQDTSGTQNRLVKLLISFWDKPNVFVVGDDDQSIYRFQGANVENMIEFANHYTNDLLTIMLTNNYRSSQPILDTSMQLINNNRERLTVQLPDISKQLISSNEKVKNITSLPEVFEYACPAHEMMAIALKAESLIQQGVEPGRIGIIYKENKYGEELARYLQVKQIPYYTKRSVNLFHDPFAKKILLLLRYLDAEMDTPYGGDAMLFEILHHDWFSIPAIEIAKLTVEVADKKFTANATSLRREIHDRSVKNKATLFDTDTNKNFARASDTIEKLISDVPNVTLLTLFEHVLNNTGIMQYVLQSERKVKLLQVLTALFDFLKEETRRAPMMTLKDFIVRLDLMQAENIPLPLVNITGTDKGVNLMTAHGSKGLEFEFVFFAGCNANFWEKKRKIGLGYALPGNLYDSITVNSDKDRDIEELRRLFYVAVTRAERGLQISYSACNHEGKALEASMFIAEILQAADIKPVTQVLDDSVVAEFQALQLLENKAPEIENSEADLMDRLLEKFVMNVTALNNYLDCPLKFYYNNLLRIPSAKNEATEFGSAVHFALQRLFERMKDNDNTFPAKHTFIDDFKWYLHRHRESFTEESYKRRLEYGEEILGNYYEKYITEWNKVVVVERTVKNVTVNGIPIKGKLDKLEFTGKEVNVVDYKTGKFENALKKLKAPDEKARLGGDYWRQAVFYKILMDNDRIKDWHAVSAEFDFIEPDTKKQYNKKKIVVSPEDVAFVTAQIKDTWQKIQQRDFYKGCGKDDCAYCNFVKDNNLFVALHNTQAEQEA